jgi:hypothetical protein
MPFALFIPAIISTDVESGDHYHEHQVDRLQMVQHRMGVFIQQRPCRLLVVVAGACCGCWRFLLDEFSELRHSLINAFVSCPSHQDTTAGSAV